MNRKVEGKGKRIGSNFENQLKNLYYNLKNVTAFGNQENLFKLIKLKKQFSNYSKNDVKKWLKKQEVHTIFKNKYINFPRNKIIVSEIDQEWAIDLADFSYLSKFNNNFKFVLFCIDLFSKVLWVRCLKNKSAQNVINALKDIFKLSRRKPNIIFSDAGSKFSISILIIIIIINLVAALGWVFENTPSRCSKFIKLFFKINNY